MDKSDFILKKCLLLHSFLRSVSSVGLERLLDRQEVSSSSPLRITDNLKMVR